MKLEVTQKGIRDQRGDRIPVGTILTIKGDSIPAGMVSKVRVLADDPVAVAEPVTNPARRGRPPKQAD